jgi:hypothetical protein
VVPNNTLPQEVKVAMSRLLPLAKSDTGQGRRIANFLLCWWNADECGGFDFRDFWNVDDEILTDMWRVLSYVATHRIYPDKLGYVNDFKIIIDRWRPRLDPVQRTILEVSEDGKDISLMDVLNTSEQCAVALAVDRLDKLPEPYRDAAAAWERLDARQRSIVARYNERFDTDEWRNRPIKY